MATAAWRRSPTVAALSLTFALLMVLSTWGVRQSKPELTPEQVTLELPQVTAGRTLDPSYVPYLERNLGGGPIVVAAGTANEKLLFLQSGMAHDRYRFRPEDL